MNKKLIKSASALFVYCTLMNVALADDDQVIKEIDRNAPIDEVRMSALDAKYHLPADPGEAGKATVSGVDSDNDGIRDDIQRKVYYWFADNEISQEYPKIIPIMLDFSRSLTKFYSTNDGKELFESRMEQGYIYSCFGWYARIADSPSAKAKFNNERYLSDDDLIWDRLSYLDRLNVLISSEFINTKERFIIDRELEYKAENYRDTVPFDKTQTHCDEFNFRWSE